MQPSHREADAPYLRIEHVSKAFGDLDAVKDVSLDVAEGELVTLLGPSGCGKTTLLRIIAGLEVHDSGSLFQAGVDISRLPPRQRDFGIVFQSYALFPNLTAAQNIAYGLENRRRPRAEIAARVQELLQLIGLPDVGKKFPSQLSGGQQQRIALARALATSPGLLLLDEPLSALDARVRVSLRLEIKQLQKRVGVTTIFVTHDQEEALVMSDRIVVMNRGRIEQVGTPQQIYRQPANPFVADFVGVMNFLSGRAGMDDRQVYCGTIALAVEAPHGQSPDSALTLAVRPEDVRVYLPGEQYANAAPGVVEAEEFLGSFYRLTLQLKGLEDAHVIAEVSNNAFRDLQAQVGDEVLVRLPPDLIRVYPGALGLQA